MTMKRVHIIGGKNSGKTTLIVELVEHLRALGKCVGTIKHTRHRHELDTPGKDSYRHRTAGTDATAIVSPGTTAVFWSADTEQSTADRYDALSDIFSQCDVVLVEGDASTNGLKVEVWRETTGKTPMVCGDPSIHALITDDQVEIDVPIWSRSDVVNLAKRLLRMTSDNIRDADLDIRY